jgi:hypothetical protein
MLAQTHVDLCGDEQRLSGRQPVSWTDDTWALNTGHQWVRPDYASTDQVWCAGAYQTVRKRRNA